MYIYPVHVGHPMQRGRGIGSFFTTLFRALTPVKNMALSLGKKAVQSNLGKELINEAKQTALQSGIHMASNVLNKKDITDGVEDDLLQGGKNMSSSLEKYAKREKRKYNKRKLDTPKPAPAKKKKKNTSTVKKKPKQTVKKKRNDLFTL